MVFGAKEVTLLTFGLLHAILKRACMMESSHKRRRGAAVVFGCEGSHAFDFWSTTLNLEVSWHQEEFARAFDFWVYRCNLARVRVPTSDAVVPQVVFGTKAVTRLTFGLAL